MRSRKKKNIYSYDLLAALVLILFIVLELMYTGIISNNSFKNSVDNFPFKIKTFIESKLKSNISHSDVLEIETSEDVETINETYVPITEKKLKFSTVDLNYFDNSLFIGDSRFEGFSIYMKLSGATYFCYQSASAFNLLNTEQMVEGFGNVKLTDLLIAHKFDKIYLSVGINSLATGIPNHSTHYKQVLDIITGTQPQAIVYLVGNMHVTDEIRYEKEYVNNDNINLVNSFINDFADNRQTFYLDPNVVYDDENGNLTKELTSDNAHVYIRYYDRLLYFFLTHALVEDM